MYRPLDHAALVQELRRHLMVRGPTPAADLYRVLGISPATLSRLLSGHRVDVLTAGRGRATRYAARREVVGDARQLPLYEVSETGETTRLGALHPVHPNGFYLDGGSALAGFYDGLPWFLDDLRPSGFLGRLLPTLHAESFREIASRNAARHEGMELLLRRLPV